MPRAGPHPAAVRARTPPGCGPVPLRPEAGAASLHPQCTSDVGRARRVEVGIDHHLAAPVPRNPARRRGLHGREQWHAVAGDHDLLAGDGIVEEAAGLRPGRVDVDGPCHAASMSHRATKGNRLGPAAAAGAEPGCGKCIAADRHAAGDAGAGGGYPRVSGLRVRAPAPRGWRRCGDSGRRGAGGVRARCAGPGKRVGGTRGARVQLEARGLPARRRGCGRPRETGARTRRPRRARGWAAPPPDPRQRLSRPGPRARRESGGTPRPGRRSSRPRRRGARCARCGTAARAPHPPPGRRPPRGTPPGR